MSEYISHQAKKRFGQNFLVDEDIIEKIILCINPKKEEALIEIGPGLAALTRHLLPKVKQLDVIEIDRDVIPELEKKCKGLGNLIIHQADALQFDFSKLIEEDKKLRIVGNLPYNISTPLLFHLINYAKNIADMHFMLQQEVVERICSAPDSKDYGRLSVMIQYYCQTEKLLIVPPEAFHPRPKIYSAIVRLKPWQEKPCVAKNIELFEKVVAQAFSMRRKTLRNTLKGLITEAELIQLNIDPQARAETISVQQFVAMANQISK